jgi:hypothetical protein
MVWLNGVFGEKYYQDVRQQSRRFVGVLLRNLSKRRWR